MPQSGESSSTRIGGTTRRVVSGLFPILLVFGVGLKHFEIAKNAKLRDTKEILNRRNEIRKFVGKLEFCK